MSRIVRFHQTGGPEVLRIDEVEVRAPKAGEVRIAVKALGLNRAESMFRLGQYLEEPSFPARHGYEAAGTVEAVGEGVQGFRPGDVVSTIPAFSQEEYGVYGELALVPATAVVKHPASLSWEEAAALWMQFATAYGALIDIAQVKAGDVVLIPAASSSVGLAAIQIANLVGATPIALTRTSASKGARVVFDPVGGPTFAKLAAATAEHGILFQYGALSPEPTPLPIMDLLNKSLTVRGYVLFEITRDPKRLEMAKRFILDGLDSGKLKPIIAKTFSGLDQIVEAHRYLESNQQVGKIVVTV